MHLAVAPDGSLVVSHGNLLLRYLPNGQLDTAFGEAGKLGIPTVEGLPFGLADIAIDNDGRILVFGTVVDPSISRFIDGYNIREVSPSFVTVLRLDFNGALDSSFGGGDGVFRADLDLGHVPADIPLAATQSAELDSEGRAVVAIRKVGFPPTIGHTAPGWVAAAVIRLTPSGGLDQSFGGGDGIIDDILGSSERTFPSDFCLTGEDELIVPLGSASLARVHPNGRLDRGFGHDGVALANGASGPPVCDRSGHVFILDGPNVFFPTRHDPSLWRVIKRSAEDGHLNRRFGRRAIIRLQGRYSILTSLTVDGRGRVLLAGTLRLPTPNQSGRSSFFTVIRLLPSGRPDRSFGRDGQIRTGFGPGTSVTAAEAAVDPWGRLIVAGNGHTPWLQPAGVLLARYLPL